MISAHEALEALRDGNRRYVAGEHDTSHDPSTARRRELLGGQEPFAVLLSCADSRVPAELVFDQGLGDLFVVRVAGNVAGPTQIGSIEFAVEHFGTPLVVVMGHSNCGAVRAVLDAMTEPPASEPSPGLASIVERIRPALEAEALPEDAEERVRHCVRLNVCAAVDELLRESSALAERVRQGRLLVVGAKYSLERGEVEFYEPASARA